MQIILNPAYVVMWKGEARSPRYGVVGTTPCITSCPGRCRQRRRGRACEWVPKERGAFQWISTAVSSAQLQYRHEEMYEDKTLITSVCVCL